MPEKIDVKKYLQVVLSRHPMMRDGRACRFGIATDARAAAPPSAAVGTRPHVTIRGLSKRFDKAVIYESSTSTFRAAS